MMQKPQKWPKCNPEIHQFITHFCDLLQHSLKEALVGVYLHGSLAMGSYYPPKSDIDVLAVVKDKLLADQAEILMSRIAEFVADCPTSGNLELSIITKVAAQKIPNPMPYELHYSDYCHERIIQG